MCCCIQAKSGSTDSLVSLAVPLSTPVARQREALRHSISSSTQPAAANGTSLIYTRRERSEGGAAAAWPAAAAGARGAAARGRVVVHRVYDTRERIIVLDLQYE